VFFFSGSEPVKFTISNITYYCLNNIHEKISPFWLVKSSRVFFLTVQKRVNSVQKRWQTKHSDWSLIKETHRWPIKSFAFKSSACPGWRNWWHNFSFIAWYTCVSSAYLFQIALEIIWLPTQNGMELLKIQLVEGEKNHVCLFHQTLIFEIIKIWSKGKTSCMKWTEMM